MESNKQPKIRFKGFSDDWKEYELGEVVSFNPKSELPDVFEYVDLESVIGTELINHRSETKISAPSRAQRLAKKGDVFYQTVRPYQKNNYLFDIDNESYVFSTGYAQLRPIINSHFLMSYIQKDNFVKQVLDRCTGTSYPAINSNALSEILIKTPIGNNEQKKIGNFLKKIENLIVHKQNKREKLKSIKKSMLAKMFPKDGCDIPEIRFKGFTDSWEELKIEEVCSISTGKNNTQDKIDDGMYPFYVRSPVIERSNRYLYEEEAVLTVGDGVGTGKVFHYVNEKYDLHQRVYRMFDFNNGVLGKYFFYYFSNHFYERVMSMTAKTSVDSVRYEMISKMDIIFPKDEQEQVKIIKSFENLDNLISLHQQELEKLKTIKKSYLENMFI